MNICICFVGSEETFSLFGKKATTSDLEFRHYIKGEITFTFVKPISNKIKTLIQAVNMSDFVIIELNEINKELGEVILLLSLLEKKGVFIVPLKKQYLIEKARQLTKEYEFKIINSNDDIKILRDKIKNLKKDYGKNPLIIIDHYFTIKGIGTVALGFTKGGEINVKDKFKLLPINKQVQINSMQSMDINFKKIDCPARIGISLKNCSINDLERGSVLSNDLKQTNEIKGEIILSPFIKRKLGKEMIINGLLVREAEFKEKTAILKNPIVITGKTIIYNENSSPRILGIIK